MRPRDKALGTLLSDSLVSFDREVHPLPGLAASGRRSVLVEQMLESVHRVHYPRRLALRPHSLRRADPNDPLFDPLRAAIIHKNAGNIDEACWLVFLFVHFGKHSRGGWRYLREVYGKRGDPIY